MASIQTSSLVSDIRGKLGDQIYARNGGGAYVKAYAAPVQPGTALQNAAQADFAAANAAWDALPEETKLQWDALADNVYKTDRLGNRRKVIGKRLFVSRKMNLLTINQNPDPFPVQQKTGSRVVSLNLTATSSTITMTAIVADVTGGAIGVLYASPYLSPNVRSPNSTRYTRINLNKSLEGGPTLDITAAWTAVWGSPAGHVGEKIFLKMQPMQVIWNQNGLNVRAGWRYGGPMFASAIIQP